MLSEYPVAPILALFCVRIATWGSGIHGIRFPQWSHAASCLSFGPVPIKVQYHLSQLAQASLR